MSKSNEQRPIARHGHRMVYDESRQMIVLFGGMGADKQPLGDTWGWDGSRWFQLSSEGPSPRAWQAMAYDRDRETVILFGGRNRYNNAPSYGDTWEWDGEQWQLVSQSGLAARDHIDLTYDPLRGRLVLFGGFDGVGTIYGDTWEWDGETWTQAASTGPPLRAAHLITFDPQLGETILFGGLNLEGGKRNVLGDTWSWNGKRWKKAAENVEGRSHYSMTCVPDDGYLIRFGGGNPERTPMGDTHKLSQGKWTAIETTGQPASIDHAMVFDSHRRKAVLFGGYVPQDGPLYNNIWEWNDNTWEQRP
jgi:hypothetical protein